MRPRTRAALAVVALLVGGWMTLPAGLAALQEPRAPESGEAPGWMGIGLQESVVCWGNRASVGAGEGVAPQPVEGEVGATRPVDGGRGREPLVRRDDCRHVLVVGGVVRGSPAEEAGIEPGDTLVAMNGRILGGPSGPGRLAALRAGEPVQVLVGRASGRMSLRVVPVPVPRGEGRMLVKVRSAPSVEGEDVVAVLPGRGAQGRPPVVYFGTAELAGTGERTTGESDPAFQRFELKVTREGNVLLREGDQTVELPDVRAMAASIRAIQDSVLSEARRHFRAVRLARQRAMEEGVGVGSGVSAPAEALTYGGPDRLRLAGAEFRVLDGQLAEYFRGATAGLLVLEVVPGTPAARLGLRPGDVVVEAEGRKVRGPSDLKAAFTPPDERADVVVKWIRKGTEMQGVVSRL